MVAPSIVTNVAGTYVIDLIVNDGQVDSVVADTVVITVNPGLAVVTIAASDANASEVGLDPGEFTLTRVGGDLSSILRVFIAITGTATNNQDYGLVAGGFVDVPAGQANITVPITPLADNLVEGDETVVFTVLANAAYQLGAVIEDTVTIADNQVLPS